MESKYKDTKNKNSELKIEQKMNFPDSKTFPILKQQKDSDSTRARRN